MAKSLFRERCEEAFVVPKPDTDRGTLILLQGVVCFAGYLHRVEMIDAGLLRDWRERLLQSGLAPSVELVLRLLLAQGSTVAAGDTVLDRLAPLMATVKDQSVIDLYNSVLEVNHSALPPQEQSDRELQRPELQRSPSVDKELDGKYGTLFKRSSSIPVELAQLADEAEEETMNSIVNQYFFKPDREEFTENVQKLGYTANDARTVADLVRAIVSQKEENQMVIARLPGELCQDGFFGEEHLFEGVKTIANEWKDSTAVGRKLAGVYAQLVNFEIAKLEQFEELFGEMRGIWHGVVPQLFASLDQLKGSSWLDDLLEIDFWRELRFVQGAGIAEKLAILKEWDVLSFLPAHEVAARFAASWDAGALKDEAVEAREVAPLVFELLVGLPEPQLATVAATLKGWFRSPGVAVGDLAARHGEGGQRVASLVQ
jgi:hypothetical protein